MSPAFDGKRLWLYLKKKKKSLIRNIFEANHVLILIGTNPLNWLSLFWEEVTLNLVPHHFPQQSEIY